MRVVNKIFPKNKYLFKQISLSRPTITRKIKELAFDLFKQVQEKANHFLYFSIDENTDMSDTAQLPIFIQGVNDNFEITDELGALA